MTLYTLTMNVGIACFAVLLFVIYPLAGLVVARHFDKIFPEFARSKDSPTNGYWIFSPCLRGFMYIGMIIFKNYAENSIISDFQNAMFDGFSFRKHARPVDWFVVWLLLLSLFFAVAASIALFIIQNL